jgi:DNA-binding transcriptional MerR regulator
LDKSPDAFRTISEVADEIEVPQHVLRFWESRFGQIRPMKRGGGRRYYRPDDVDLLRGVRHLLYGEGYTIRGVQRILREEGAAFVQNIWRAGAPPPPPESDEDRAEEELIDAAPGARVEPNLASLGLAASRVQGHAGDEAPPQRHHQSVAVPLATVQPPRQGITDEARRKLQAALDELVACRRSIDAALSGEDALESAIPFSEVRG